MNEKQGIEVFQDLSIVGPEGKRTELRQALIEAVAAPWKHGQDAEKDLSRMARGEDIIVFQREADSRLPAAGLTLWAREAGYEITNIVPKKMGQLTYAQYNALLQEFDRNIARPAASKTGFAVNVSAPRQTLEQWVSPEAAKVPAGERWIHEIKFDGYRAQVHLANEAVKIFTRRGNDWTKRFKKVAHDAWRIKAASAVIDGEIVVPAADGTTDFSVLQNELKGKSKSIVLVAFDLLYLNGRDLRKLPLTQRKIELRKIIAGTEVQFSESFEIEGAEMFAHACKLGLEGVVSKVRDSIYASGRGNNWVKKTCAQRETLTIAGFALDEGKWDGIYLARRKGRDLVYAGKVDHGFDKASVAGLQRRLKPLIRKTQPYAKRITHKGVWVEPKLLVEIEYRAKSAEGKVRHPFFKGLRDDL
jgi:bifunctional non-homologous end joining protein LigD